MTLQRLNFDWSQFGGTPIVSSDAVDACTTTNYLIRIYLNTFGDLVVARHDGDPASSWSAVHSISSPQTPWCVVASGTTIRVFYNNGSNIVYKESTDEGDTWGSAQTVMSSTNVDHLAAASTTRLHYVTYDTYNSRFRYVKYSLGAWTSYSGDLYYPGQLENLSAVKMGYHDIIAFSALGPKRYTLQSQGIWMTRVQSITRKNTTLWCDPREVDVLDEYVSNTNDRTFPHLALVNGLLFCTYVSNDAGSKQCSFSRSETGRFWEIRQPLGPFNGSDAFRGKLLALGTRIYYVGAGYSYWSSSTVLSGNSTVETDYTSRVGSYQAVHQRARQIKLDLHNDDAGISAALENDRWQIKEELGYYASDGDPLLVQVGQLEIDTITRANTPATNIVTLVGRDRMSWLSDRSGADQYEERESQLRHWDDYTGDQGMRYTAVMDGTWDTDSSTLRLEADGNTGSAMCSRKKFIGHTVVQAGIKIPTNGGTEWVGLIFRAQDSDNFWYAYYNDADDKIHLQRRYNGAWGSPVASSAAMGWTGGTQYYMRVEARFSRFVVYTSTAGKIWTQTLTYVDQTMGGAVPAFQEGYVGHIGKGAA